MRRSLLFVLALCAPTAAYASHVVLSGERYLELLPEDAPIDTSTAPAPFAATREVVVSPAPDGVAVRATWRIGAAAPGWFDGLVAGPGVRVERVTIDGADAPTTSGADGTRLVVHVDHPVVIALIGFVDGDSTVGIDLRLMPAVRGTLRAEGTTRSLSVESAAPAVLDGAAWVTAADQLHLALIDPAPAVDKPPLWVGAVGIGLTVGDTEVSGAAHVEWQVRQGEVVHPAIRVTGVGSDIDVTGSNVRSWHREGDLLVIAPMRPVHDRLAVELKWTEPIAAGAEARVTVPTLAPDGAFRTTTTLQLAREDAIEVVPALDAAWTALPSSAVARESEGPVAGTPTATFQTGRRGGGSLSLLRFTPVEQPPVVVDVAAITLATNDEGRVLMRGYFTVRNERAAALRIVPPDGVDLLGVQVSGSPVTPGRDGGPG